MISLLSFLDHKGCPRYAWTVVTVALFLSVMIGSPRAEMECSSATASSITLIWITPGDDGSIGLASQYDIRYAQFEITEENWTLATRATGVPVPKPAGRQETFVVSGLDEATQYYFAIRTADEVPNWSPLSPVVCRRTLASGQTAVPNSIPDLAITAPAPTSLTLRWTSPDNGSGGNAFLYLVQYSKDSITSANLSQTTVATGVPRPGPVGSIESCTVNGLDPSEVYYFSVRTCNVDFVWSELSNIASDTTLLSGAPEDVAFAYPNPFKPADNSAVTFANIPANSDLSIRSVSGYIVREWLNSTGEDILWDGTNESGNAVASGVYSWYVHGTEMNGKLIIIR
jgi:hypothetical protein